MQEERKNCPLFRTISVTDINGSNATSGGEVSDEGGSPVTARGVCWSGGTTPTIADNKTIDGTGGSGSFTSNLTGLSGNMNYHIRAYATNSAGTGYGMPVSFTSFGTGAHL